MACGLPGFENLQAGNAFCGSKFTAAFGFHQTSFDSPLCCLGSFKVRHVGKGGLLFGLRLIGCIPQQQSQFAAVSGDGCTCGQGLSEGLGDAELMGTPVVYDIACDSTSL